MATYTELAELRNDSTLLERIASGIQVEIARIVNLGGTQDNVEARHYLHAVMANPDGEAQRVWAYIIAVNSNRTKAQIQDVYDTIAEANANSMPDTASIEFQVQAVLPKFVKAKSRAE